MFKTLPKSRIRGLQVGWERVKLKNFTQDSVPLSKTLHSCSYHLPISKAPYRLLKWADIAFCPMQGQ